MIAAFVVILASVGIITSALFGMFNRLTIINKENTKSQIYQAALSSILNYTRAGIKRRWCFTDSWEQENSASCDLTHPRSSERLLMTLSTLNHVKELLQIKTNLPHADPIKLESFSSTLDLSGLSNSNPIKRILSGPDFGFISGVKISVEHITTIDVIHSGDAVFLKVTAELIADASKAPGKLPRLKGWSKFSAYPRENGGFALIVPGDLYLGKSRRVRGDIQFPAGSSKGMPGVVFQSPVFVNGNIVLPDSNANSYVPVTFGSPVIQGAGIVKRDGHPYATKTAGGDSDALYSDMTFFGGFSEGLQVDGVRDLGLDAFSNQVNTPAPDPKLMQQCIERAAIHNDLAKTDEAALVVRSTGSFSWDLSWTKSDFFKPQDISGTPNAQCTDFACQVQSSSNQSPIVNVSFNSGSKTVSNILLPRQGQVTITSKFGSSDKPFTITLKTNPFTSSGLSQENIANFTVSISDPDQKLQNFNLKLTAFDVGFLGGKYIRPAGNTAYTSLNLSFKQANGKWSGPGFGSQWGRADGQPASSADLAIDENWEEIEAICRPTNTNGLAFQPSSWDTTFDMRSSWNLLPAGKVEFRMANASLPDKSIKQVGASINGSILPTFNIFSIASECNIHADANFVAGFFVCEKLTITPRSTPLRIIGTIVTNTLDISPTAYESGITWSSIYNTNAVLDLRAARILKPYTAGGTCDVDPSRPIWNPFADILSEQDSLSCNSLSLRIKFDPIRWTAIDPDCGLDNSNPSVLQPATMCKYHAVHYTVPEFDRGFEW